MVQQANQNICMASVVEEKRDLSVRLKLLVVFSSALVL
jgi:hypothetical protein